MMLKPSRVLSGFFVAVTFTISFFMSTASSLATCEGADGEIWCPDYLPHEVTDEPANAPNVISSCMLSTCGITRHIKSLIGQTQNTIPQFATECEGADGEIWCPDNLPWFGSPGRITTLSRCSGISTCGMVKHRVSHNGNWPQITTECEGADGEIWCPD